MRLQMIAFKKETYSRRVEEFLLLLRKGFGFVFIKQIDFIHSIIAVLLLSLLAIGFESAIGFDSLCVQFEPDVY